MKSISGAQEPGGDRGPWPIIWIHIKKGLSCLKLVGKFLYLFIFNPEVLWRYYKKQKLKIFFELENQILLGKHSNQYINIKLSFKSDPFNKPPMNNVLYFSSKYLKRTFEKSHIKKVHQICSWYQIFLCLFIYLFYCLFYL